MKILISRLTDGTFGGAELSAIDHAWSYKKLGHEVVFITNLPRSKTTGIKTYWVPWPNKSSGVLKILTFPLAMIYQALVTLSIGYTFKPDVMNPHSRDDQVLQTLLRPLHGVPVVWKDPADLRHFLERNSGGFFWKVNNRLLYKAVERADCIYTLNPSEKELIQKSLARLGVSEPPIEIIPSSIRYENYDLNEHSLRKENKLIISTVIRLDEHKGVQYLIEAYKKVATDDTELWIVGDGPYRQTLEQIAKNREDITFHGFQTDVSRYYGSSDIFVQPAEFEGWGRNVKEAMYFDLPVVGSDVGGIAKQITDGKNGLLFQPKNIEQLSEKISLLINDEVLRKELGTAAKKKALADGDYVDLVRNKVIPLFEKYARGIS